MNHKHLHLVAYLLLTSVFGQNYSVKNYNTDQNLPSSEFYDVYKDNVGYVWFTSDRGIVRYNSYEFETFSLKDGLSNLVNFTFYRESDHTFWVNGVDGSFTFWNGENFVPFRFNNKLIVSSKLDSNWNEIIKTDSEYIYFIKSRSLDPVVYRIHKHTGELTQKLEDRLPISKNCSHKTVRTINLINTLASNTFSIPLLQLKNNYSYVTDTLILIHQKKSIIHNEFLTPKNELFLMSDSGLMLFDKEHQEQSTYIIKNAAITSALITPFNEIWATSLTKGIFRISSTNTINLEAFQGKNIDGLYVNDDTLFAKSIVGEVYQVNKENEILTAINQGNRGFYKGYVDPTHSSAFYFGGVRYLNNDLNSNRENEISKQTISKNHAIEYDYSSYKIFKNEELVFSEKSRVLSLHFDAKFIYIGTYNGIREIPISKDSDIANTNIQEITKGIRINDIKKSKDFIWAGSLGKGIFYKINSTWAKLEAAELSSLSIHSIVPENDSILWVATNKGLNKVYFKKEKDRVKIHEVDYFNTSKGLNSDYIKDIALFNDRLYIATNNGICFLKEQKTDYPKPSLVINEFQVNNSLVDTLSLVQKLAYDENDIKIKFTGISNYKPINDYFYSYNLLKKNSQNKTQDLWNTTNTRVLEFLNLNPGHYVFQVKCKNLDGISSDIQSIEFLIQPHFTNTLYFKLFVFTILTLLLVLFWHRRTTAIKNKLSLQLRAKSAELDTLRNQINPHFIFNSINAIQNYIFSDKKAEANLYISNLSKIIRKGLHLSRTKSISLLDEVQFIQDYLALEKMRFQNKFEFKLTYDDEINNSSLKIPPLISQPVVENAVKHAFKNINYVGKIDIKYTVLPQFVVIDIIDNGIGIKPLKKLCLNIINL